MALPSFGTNTSFDTLKSSTQTIAQFNKDRAWDAVASLLDMYNAQRDEVTSLFTQKTTGRYFRYGAGAGRKRMQRLSELGIPNAQKTKSGSILGLPLENWGVATQWTSLYWQTVKMDQFAAEMMEQTTASNILYMTNLKKTIFNHYDYNFTDYRVDHIDGINSLPVRAFINADGQAIPPGPNGESFNANTHNHYLASATLTNAWAVALIDTVTEHFREGTPIVWISKTDVATWEALADFKELAYVTTIKADNQEYGVGNAEVVNLNNRQVGWFHGAAVWVKPYIPASYCFCFMAGQTMKPIGVRVRGTTPDGGEMLPDAGNLKPTYKLDEHPLHAEVWEEEYGMGVLNRHCGAVGYFGGATYVIPDYTTF